mgnify:FL=1
MRNSMINIKITDHCNQLIIDRSMKEGDISGYTGYMINLGNRFGMVRLEWTIHKDLLIRWPCNPSRFIPQLLTILLKYDSVYFHFFEPLFNALSLNDKRIVLASLPWLRLITGNRCHIKKLTKMFLDCYHKQSPSESELESLQLDSMIENGKIFYPSLSKEQQMYLFRYFCEQFENYLMVDESKLVQIKDHQQLIDLIILFHDHLFVAKKKYKEHQNSEFKDVYKLIELMRQFVTNKRIEKNVRNCISYLITIFDE